MYRILFPSRLITKNCHLSSKPYYQGKFHFVQLSPFVSFLAKNKKKNILVCRIKAKHLIKNGRDPSKFKEVARKKRKESPS